jgi:hypothetical protein
MFTCERCGSSYNPVHAVAFENCPRCQVRDRISTPLTFKVFNLSAEEDGKAAPQEGELPRPRSLGSQIAA